MDNTRFQFKPSTHTYTLDGKRMTGVTTVLGVIAKPMLIGWASKMACEYVKENLKDINDLDEVLALAVNAHTKKKEKAGQAGTDTHAQVEVYVKGCIATNEGNPVNAIKVETPALNSFIQWAIENKVKFLESEKVMYSEKWFVGGTCDLVFEQDGKRYVGDVKTMKKMWDRVPYFQCAAYMEMLRENDKQKYDGSCIINIPKETNQVETFYSYDHESDLKAFEAALVLPPAFQNN